MQNSAAKIPRNSDQRRISHERRLANQKYRRENLYQAFLGASNKMRVAASQNRAARSFAFLNHRTTLGTSLSGSTSIGSRKHFFLLELFIYLSQVFMFFIVAVMASNFLGDEETLVRFMNSKINDQSFNEVGFMLVAIVVTVGVLTTIASMVRNSSWQELLTREVLRELPRAIYAFGSSVSGPMIAAGVFIS
ncbi:MAG TPA: hypothetical protein VGE22_19600, partial [Solimonas sp.]